MNIAPADIQIRRAAPGDAEPLVGLVDQLGYAMSLPSLREKLLQLGASSTDQVFVAVAGESLLGCIGLHLLPLLHATGNLGRITALVVDAAHRGQGIGARLMRASHAWLRHMDCVRFEVTSGDQRQAAHRFYEKHGYARSGQRLARGSVPA